MHNNDWLQRNKVIKPGTARSGMQAAGTKTQELREKNAKNQHFVSTGCLTQTIKNGNVVKTNFQIKKSIAPQKQTIQTILEKNSKQISVIATNSKVDNQQAKRLKLRLCHSLAGDNNPNNNLNKAETDAKVNNAKINSKNNERIKIQQKNNQLIFNRIENFFDNRRYAINQQRDYLKIISDIKSIKIENLDKGLQKRFDKIIANINYQTLGIDAEYKEANRSNIHNNHQNRYPNQNDANVTFGQQSNHYPLQIEQKSIMFNRKQHTYHRFTIHHLK